MAENLRVTHDANGRPIQSYCYDDEPANCGEYGRLYTWQVAMSGETSAGVRGICPSGWHIPADEEWHALVEYLGGSEVAGQAMATGGLSGFEAPLGGGADFRGAYVYLNEYGLLWASTEVNAERAYHQAVSDKGESSHFASRKAARVSVRCVREE